MCGGREDTIEAKREAAACSCCMSAWGVGVVTEAKREAAAAVCSWESGGGGSLAIVRAGT